MDWHLLGLSLVTIFIAELADRSSLAAFALSGSSKHPRAVFLGTASALLVANLLGALMGGKVAELLPIQLVKIIAALGFSYLAIRLLWLENNSSQDKKNYFRKPTIAVPSFLKQLTYNPHNRVWSVFSATFLTIFLTSLGDEEQIATMLLSAQSSSPLTVFVGAALAVILTSLLAVLLGQGLARWLSPKVLKTASGVILLLISVWLFWDVLYPEEIENFKLF